MVAAIVAFLQALPEIISLIKSLVSWIQKEQDAAARKALLNKFAAATQAAVETGNTSDLEAIFKTGNS